MYKTYIALLAQDKVVLSSSTSKGNSNFDSENHAKYFLAKLDAISSDDTEEEANTILVRVN